MSRFMDGRLRALVPYTPGEQPQNIPDLIKLNTNENPFPPSPRVEAALNSGETRQLRLYSDPACGAFLQALAHTLGVETEQVFASNGSDEALAFCFQALCPHGAVFADLTYGFYPVFAALYGVPFTELPLREDFSLAVEDYAECRQTVFLANPNAPTGLALPRAKVEALLRQDPERLVVVDEAYVDFGAESAVPLLRQYENLLVIGTFSKSRCLAGARLGYAVGSRALIADLNTVKFSFNPYNVNRLTLRAGTAALEDASYFSACCQEICAVREDTARALRALGFSVTDSKANFLFAAPPARAASNRALTGTAYCAMLRKNGILVRRFDDKERIANYARITIGTRQQMERLLFVTTQWLKGETV